jgi:hypothetical protein
MNNTITEQILNYRYKTNAYIALLNENNYFSPAISNSCSADILKKVIQSTNLIVEGALPYPKSLVKKYQLNEQAGVEKVVRGVEAAMKAMEAARTARELEAATKVGKLGAEAGEATKALSTVVAKETKPLIDLPPVVQPADIVKAINSTEVPKHVTAGANVLMNYVQYKALELAQSGYRGEELADLVRENVRGHNVFHGIDLTDPVVSGQLKRVNDASKEIITTAEQVAEAQKSGKSFDPRALRDYSGSTEDLSFSGKPSKESGMTPEDIFDLKGFLKQEGKRLQLDVEAGKRAQEAQPNVDWSSSIGMPQKLIRRKIKAAEEAAQTRAAQGKKTVEELSPHLTEVENNVSNLNYELARRKAESMLFTPEELEARKKMLADLESYNAPKVKVEKEAAEAAEAARRAEFEAEIVRIRKDKEQRETERIQQSVKARQAEIDAENARKAKEWDESLTRRAENYSQMTPEEQAEFTGRWSKRPKDRESLKTILQRAEEMLKGPSVPPAP